MRWNGRELRTFRDSFLGINKPSRKYHTATKPTNAARLVSLNKTGFVTSRMSVDGLEMTWEPDYISRKFGLRAVSEVVETWSQGIDKLYFSRNRQLKDLKYEKND